jgi:glyoxylate/hydroxypyruvate reductase A
MTLRIVFCARETAAQVWAEALRAALRQHGVDADIWSRNAEHGVADPHAPQADVAVVWRPPAALFDEQRQLQAVFNLGAGVDALLALPTLPSQASVFRLEDAGMAQALSEYVLAAVLRVYRRFDRYALSQSQRRWQPETMPARNRYAVGVAGLGVIGAAVAGELAAHGFAVRGHARSRKSIEGVDCRAGESEWASFLDGLDVLVSVLPTTDATRGLLDGCALERLARGAHVINVGRGATLVEADLLARLDSGHLCGATLDVFATEPLPPDHPFWSRREIVITPHVAAETELVPAIEQVAGKLARWSRGEAVSGGVDRDRGY